MIVDFVRMAALLRSIASVGNLRFFITDLVLQG
jgi:hypothetical protein